LAFSESQVFEVQILEVVAKYSYETYEDEVESKKKDPCQQPVLNKQVYAANGRCIQYIFGRCIQYIFQYIRCIENWHDVLKCIEGCIGCIVITAGLGCIE
jgi:hypothetical protein